MRLKDWFVLSDPCKPYDTHERLFQGLQRSERQAVVCLQLKALQTVKKLVSQYSLPAEMTDDILNQSTLIFLHKIDEGSYQFQNNAPSSYLIEIARRLVM